jgi:hypothetical protein
MPPFTTLMVPWKFFNVTIYRMLVGFEVDMP